MKSAVILLIIFAVPSFILGRFIPDWQPAAEIFYEQATLFQGDIKLLPGQLDKNGVLLEEFYWPNATIYYQLEGLFESDETKRELVMTAISDYHNKTCVRFEPYDGSQKSYVAITNEGSPGCSSFIGRLGVRQIVDLKVPGCDRVRTIIHELMHAVGFYHEQSRMDRDDYVDILWENIAIEYQFNFLKVPSTPFNVSYDYDSVVHYGQKDFSDNGNDTIVPKDPDANIGLGQWLSEKDAIKINRMYNCTEFEGTEQ